MPAAVVPVGVTKRVNVEFVRRYPELLSRLSRIARRFQDEDEVCAELAAFSYLNFRSVFLRRGECLTPGAMAFVAWKHTLAGRTLVCNSVRDVHSALAQRRNRVHVVHLSQLSNSGQSQALSDTVVDRIVGALSTGEREQPDIRAQVRLDWRALARQLPARMRRILHWLAIGASRTWIARKLSVSNGRISQILDTLGREIAASRKISCRLARSRALPFMVLPSLLRITSSRHAMSRLQPDTSPSRRPAVPMLAVGGHVPAA